MARMEKNKTVLMIFAGPMAEAIENDFGQWVYGDRDSYYCYGLPKRRYIHESNIEIIKVENSISGKETENEFDIYA